METLLVLWQQSDWVIKSVGLILVIMSIISWYMIVDRFLLNLRAYFYEKHAFANLGPTLHTIPPNIKNPFYYLVKQTEDDMRMFNQSKKTKINANEWINESLRDSIDYVWEQQQSGIGILASIASTAPFIGLFGTVWGIYHALTQIATDGQTSIDQIAGPVGEALIMTALGLAVAIPAVLAYNLINRFNRKRTDALNHFARKVYAYHMIDTGEK